MKKLIKNFSLLLISTIILSNCSSNINIPSFEQNFIENISINKVINRSENNFNNVIQVVNENNNGGISKIIQRNNKDFVLVYATEKLGDKNIYITISNNGKNWNKPLKISENKLSQSNPTIIEDNGTLRVFYSSNESGNWEIFQTTSNDALNWTNPEKVNLDYQGVNKPQIIKGKNNELILIFEAFGNGIFTASSDNGKNWQIHNVALEGKNPGIEFINNKYISVFEKNNEIFITESNDLNNWSNETKIPTLENSKEPSIKLYKNDLTIFYSSKVNNNWQIFKQKMTTNNWSNPVKLTNNIFNNIKPSIYSNNNFSLLSWTVENSDSLINNKSIYLGFQNN